MAGDEWQWRANPKRRAEAPASTKANRGFSRLAVNCRLLTSCCGGLTKPAKAAEAGEEFVGGGGARTISGLALPVPSRKDQDPSPSSLEPQAVISSGGVLGPVVDGFGLCNWMLPPAKGRVVITTPEAPVNGPLVAVIFSPNLSTPMPGSPLSSVLARNLTVGKAGLLVSAVPQMSRTFEPAAGSKYPSMVSLLTCSPANIPAVSWSTKLTWPKKPPFLQPPTRPKFA